MNTFKGFATLFVLFVMAAYGVMAQSAYWVFMTDKAGTSFDPYGYFDAKAIERYNACGADLYDISNYPVSATYEQGVGSLATEVIGASRWMNALGIMATPDQVAAIEALPYVLRVQPIEGTGLQLASATQAFTHSSNQAITLPGILDVAHVDGPLEAQLVRMGGKLFREAGIDGRGVRIAVFDGGFPQVNTHVAFKHLRDEGRIVKTWNFCNKCENVYGWNSHGTMTLSCIAGREGDKDLGLATGAEFLLARTEIDLEPFKEEVWWQMAVEWADKNGANIISSSLGYGKERHYTKDMDGTSYVAKAGNLAARKGILVVNSAGNEADDKQWKTIITPADADSVLCVGGIENSLTEYNHIEFSSYGPSADGRQKPNVCAFGYARTANVGGNDTSYHYVHGTSFSCPLVAGFAACAWQASKGKTAMEMFRMIEQSADLYPYCDYAFGYGVPQADFFTQPSNNTKPQTFRFVSSGDSVRVVPTRPVKHGHLFYSYRRPSDHRLAYYGKIDVTFMDETEGITFSKAAIYNRTLTVHLDGYTDSLRLTEEEYQKYRDASGFRYNPIIDESAVAAANFGRKGEIRTSQWGSNSKYRYDVFVQYGLTPNTMSDEMTVVYSDAIRIGARLLRAFSKSYCIGIGLDYGNSFTNFPLDRINAIDNITSTTLLTGTDCKRVDLSEWSLEIFQRIRLIPGGQLTGRGIFWDLGVFGSCASNRYTVAWDHTASALYNVETRTFGNLDDLANHRWNYGLATRFGYSAIAVYARYRLSSLIGKSDSDLILPRLEVGLEMAF